MATDTQDENVDLDNLNGNLDSEESKEDEEEEEPEAEPEAEEDEEEEDAVPLTASIVAEGLSLVSKVSDGFAHAYVRLSLKERELSNIDAIKQFIYLRYVDLSNNYIKSLQPLENLTTILVLKVDSNKIQTVDLPEMRFLQILSLNNNKLKSLNGMNFPLLEQLSVNENDITDISGLDPDVFSNLHTLEVRGNKIKSTKSLNLPNLKHLYLAENKITELAGLSNLTSLQTLHLRNNTTLNNLDGLSESNTSLKILNLRSTEISNFAEIVKLGAIQSLNKVSLVDTPIASEGNYRVEVLSYIKSLTKLDKEEITEEEITEAHEIIRQRSEEDNSIETPNAKE